MKLYIENGQTPPALQYLNDGDTPPAGYTETTDPIDWDKYQKRISVDYKAFRNEMITKFETNWSGYADSQKKALLKHYIYPSETSAGELDGLYSAADRDKYQVEVMAALDCIDCRPRRSTVTTTKYFDMQLDDDGVLTNVEITSDNII